MLSPFNIYAFSIVALQEGNNSLHPNGCIFKSKIAPGYLADECLHSGLSGNEKKKKSKLSVSWSSKRAYNVFLDTVSEGLKAGGFCFCFGC